MTKKLSKPSMEELLAKLPDTGFSKGEESNEAAEYVAAHPETWGPLIQTSRGRPKRGEETGSITKSIRFPEEAWTLIKKKAVSLNLPVHAAMRKALMDWAMAPDESSTPSPTPAPSPMVYLMPSIAPTPSWATSDVPSYANFLNINQGSGSSSRSQK